MSGSTAAASRAAHRQRAAVMPIALISEAIGPMGHWAIESCLFVLEAGGVVGPAVWGRRRSCLLPICLIYRN